MRDYDKMLRNSQRGANAAEREKKRKQKTMLITALILSVIALASVIVLVIAIREVKNEVNNINNVPTAAVRPTGTVDPWEQTHKSDDQGAVSVTIVTPEPTVLTPTPTPTRMPVIMLDPGHACRKDNGDYDYGTNGYWRDDIHTQSESELVWDIAAKLRELLVNEGYEVIMTREGNDDPGRTIAARRDFANESDIDAYISIHMNAYPEDRSVGGIETFYNPEKNENSKALAEAIHSNLLISTHAKNRYVKQDNEYAVIKTDKPACLIETGFLSSETEWELLTSDNYRALLAQGIFNGIKSYVATVVYRDNE